MAYTIFYKDVADSVNLTVDWAEWLSDSDAISTSFWVLPTGGELTGTTMGKTASWTSIWIAGGVVGEHYKLENHITTTSGRTTKRTIIVRVTDK